MIICLGITCILCVLLFVYFNNKMNNVQHKINTLFAIIEQEATKQRTINHNQNIHVVEQSETNTHPTNLENSLIEVSDEDDSGEDDSDDDDYSSTLGSDNDADNDKNLENEEADENELLESCNDDACNVKHLSITNVDNNNSDITIQPMQVSQVDQEIYLHKPSTDIPYSNTFQSDDNYHDETASLDHENNVSDEENDTDLNEMNKTEKQENEELLVDDYKKLSVSKLREIVKDKNLHDEPKKLKKHELIELLSS